MPTWGGKVPSKTSISIVCNTLYFACFFFYVWAERVAKGPVVLALYSVLLWTCHARKVHAQPIPPSQVWFLQDKSHIQWAAVVELHTCGLGMFQIRRPGSGLTLIKKSHEPCQNGGNCWWEESRDIDLKLKFQVRMCSDTSFAMGITILASLSLASALIIKEDLRAGFWYSMTNNLEVQVYYNDKLRIVGRS